MGIDLDSRWSVGDGLLLLCGLRGGREFPNASVVPLRPPLGPPQRAERSILDPDKRTSRSLRHLSLSICTCKQQRRRHYYKKLP